MRVLRETLTASLLLLFFLFIDPSKAEIKVQYDDRPLIFFEKFPFTHTGNIITVSIFAVSVTSFLSQPDPSRQGFFLLPEESLIEFMLELKQDPNYCVLDSKLVVLFFTLGDSSLHRSYYVTYPGNYSLFFANCKPESLITMDVHTEMFDGATNNYLSPKLTQSLYFVFSIVYLCFLGFWIFGCFRNQQFVHQIHLLMGAFLFMKSLRLLCAAEDKYFVRVTGNSHGWNDLFYIFQFINFVLSFVLIGSGWRYLKPLLLEKEKKVLMIVIPLQVLANEASIVIGETGPFYKDWVTWNQVFLLADFICCCAIIFPWSMRSFSKTRVKGVRNLKVFRVFCEAVIGYLLFTSIDVFAMKILVVYKDWWVFIAAEEIITRIVFYLVMFYMFRPVDDFILDDGSEVIIYEEAAELVKG